MTVTCSVCGEVITDTRNATKTVEGEYVCMNCATHDYITRCQGCGGWIIKREGRQRCANCEEQIYKNNINGYCTKPIPQFKNSVGENGKEYNVRYYGLEMEFNNCDCTTIHELCNNLYLDKWIYNKRDGSIDRGVEVVTSPMDKKSLNKLMKEMQPIFDYVEDHDYKHGAGLHIHVSKNSISPQDRYKICILLNNSKRNKERNILYYLSGRTSKPLSDVGVDDHYFRIGVSDSLNCRATGHSVALNTSNRCTYEFRIFKSTNKPEVIKSYVELVDTMIDFCHINGIKDITVQNYIQYLKANTKDTVLLEKIDTYERKCGKILSKRPILLNNEIMDMLKGINWSDYYKVMYAIQRFGRRSLRDIQTTINELSSCNLTVKPSDDEVINRLDKTLRACLIKEIQDKEREIKECA